MKHPFTNFRAIVIKLDKPMKGKILLAFVLSVAVGALATPPFGVLLNQIVAMGTASEDIKEELHVASTNASGDQKEGAGDQEWLLHLRTHGASDFYVQQLVLAPGGYSGWHTHPGLLVGTVVSGAIDFYDANCEKRSFNEGQVFTENTEVHAIKNPGTVNTTLSIAYLIRHGEPRRVEAAAPDCASSTGIP
jgi:quercetin dioxygenase-like cupin family protein